MKIFSTGVLVLALTASVCADGVFKIITSKDQAQKECNLGPGAEANRRFAYSIYRTTSHKGNPFRNIFIAPTTIATSLSMLLAGAEGATREQIWSGLGFDSTKGFTKDDIPCLLKVYRNDLFEESLKSKQKAAPANIEVDHTNPLVIRRAGRLYGEKSFGFNESFLQETSLYGAEMQLLDFINATENSRQTINDWVATVTEDKILDLLPPGSLDSSTKLAIVSAIYFQGMWKIPFNEGDTMKGTFTVSKNRTVEVNYMMKKEKYRWLFSDEMDANLVEVPYKEDEDGRYNASMILIIPRNELGINSTFLTEERLGRKNGTIPTLLSKKPDTINLVLPRFRIDAEYQLKPMLRRIGIKNIFDPDRSELQGMMNRNASDGQPLYVNTAVHKTFIQVDEKGTEASGATMFGVAAHSLPYTIVADRPFITIIYDKKTDSILFIGRVSNPAS